MPEFFDNLRRSYTDVTIDESGINTAEFLEASEGLVSMFDLLGSAAFSVVQKDMTGNIKKIRDRQLAHPSTSMTLESLVENEVKEKNRTATQGLLWLTRGLSFTAVALRRNVNNSAEELSTSFTKAYENTLRKHHSMLIRPVFSLAMKACPYRKDFYEKLGSDQAKVQQQLQQWLSALEKIVASLNVFYEKTQYGKGL
ncbi:hypothetical protein YB2330_000431 [Saitoella coloradoensis]